MSRMVKIVHEELIKCVSYQEGQAAIGAAAPPVTWVDDLAVPLATASAEDLIPIVQETTAILHATFQRFGMSLNMAHGKTEVVLMYRGREANKFRTKLFDTSGAANDCDFHAFSCLIHQSRSILSTSWSSIYDGSGHQ